MTNLKPAKSAARVGAGRRNQQLQGPLSADARQRLREAALQHQPWRFSTGPRSAAGKAQVAMNGRLCCKGELSVRQQRAAVADVQAQMVKMAGLRRQALDAAAGSHQRYR